MMQNTTDVVLKMHYADNLIGPENGTTSINIFECFLKLDVRATLYILWQCTNSNWFCHLYQKHALRFQDFVHSLGYSRNM